MIVKLLTERHLEFLSLTGGCRGSYESTHVKMSNCWKSHAVAQFSSCYHMAVGDLCIFLAVLWVGLQSVIVAFSVVSVSPTCFVRNKY